MTKNIIRAIAAILCSSLILDPALAGAQSSPALGYLKAQQSLSVQACFQQEALSPAAMGMVTYLLERFVHAGVLRSMVLTSERTKIEGNKTADDLRHGMEQAGETTKPKYTRLGESGSQQREHWISHHYAPKSERHRFASLLHGIQYALTEHDRWNNPFIMVAGASNIFFSMWWAFGRSALKGYGLRGSMARAWAANQRAHRQHNKKYEGTGHELNAGPDGEPADGTEELNPQAQKRLSRFKGDRSAKIAIRETLEMQLSELQKTLHQIDRLESMLKVAEGKKSAITKAQWLEVAERARRNLEKRNVTGSADEIRQKRITIEGQIEAAKAELEATNREIDNLQRRIETVSSTAYRRVAATLEKTVEPPRLSVRVPPAAPSVKGAPAVIAPRAVSGQLSNEEKERIALRLLDEAVTDAVVRKAVVDKLASIKIALPVIGVILRAVHDNNGFATLEELAQVPAIGIGPERMPAIRDALAELKTGVSPSESTQGAKTTGAAVAAYAEEPVTLIIPTEQPAQGEFFRRLRIKLDWIQSKLAHELKIGRSLLSGIENGHNTASPELLARLADILRVELNTKEAPNSQPPTVTPSAETSVSQGDKPLQPPSRPLRTVPTDLSQIPKFIQSVRTEDFDLPQEKFAKLLGIDRSYLSRLENGHDRPNPKVLANLSRLIQEDSGAVRSQTSPAIEKGSSVAGPIGAAFEPLLAALNNPVDAALLHEMAAVIRQLESRNIQPTSERVGRNLSRGKTGSTIRNWLMKRGMTFAMLLLWTRSSSKGGEPSAAAEVNAALDQNKKALASDETAVHPPPVKVAASITAIAKFPRSETSAINQVLDKNDAQTELLIKYTREAHQLYVENSVFPSQQKISAALGKHKSAFGKFLENKFSWGEFKEWVLSFPPSALSQLPALAPTTVSAPEITTEEKKAIAVKLLDEAANVPDGTVRPRVTEGLKAVGISPAVLATLYSQIGKKREGLGSLEELKGMGIADKKLAEIREALASLAESELKRADSEGSEGTTAVPARQEVPSAAAFDQKSLDEIEMPQAFRNILNKGVIALGPQTHGERLLAACRAITALDAETPQSISPRNLSQIAHRMGNSITRDALERWVRVNNLGGASGLISFARSPAAAVLLGMAFPPDQNKTANIGQAKSPLVVRGSMSERVPPAAVQETRTQIIEGATTPAAPEAKVPIVEEVGPSIVEEAKAPELPWEQAGLEQFSYVIMLLQGLGKPATSEQAMRLIADRLRGYQPWTDGVKGFIKSYLMRCMADPKLAPVAFDQIKALEDLQDFLEGLAQASGGTIHLTSANIDEWTLRFTEALSQGMTLPLEEAARTPVPTAPVANVGPAAKESASTLPAAKPTVPSVAQLFRAQQRLLDTRTARHLFKSASAPPIAKDLFARLLSLRRAAVLIAPISRELPEGSEKIAALNLKLQIDNAISTLQAELKPEIEDRIKKVFVSLSDAALTNLLEEGSLISSYTDRIRGAFPNEFYDRFSDWIVPMVWAVAAGKASAAAVRLAEARKQSRETNAVKGYQLYVVKSAWLKEEALFDNGERSQLAKDVQKELDKFFRDDEARGFYQKLSLLKRGYWLDPSDKRVVFQVEENGKGPAIIFLAADHKGHLARNSRGSYEVDFEQFIAQFNTPEIIVSLRDKATKLNFSFIPQQTPPSLGVHSWIWNVIDLARSLFGKPGLSRETQARNAFWVEQLPYLISTFIAVLPSILTLAGVSTPSDVQSHRFAFVVASLTSWVVLNVLFGAGHAELLKWNDTKDKVISHGPTSWKQRLGFMGMGAQWQLGLALASAVGIIPPAMFGPSPLVPFALMLLLQTVGHVVAMFRHERNNSSGSWLSVNRKRKGALASLIRPLEETGNYRTVIVADGIFDALAQDRTTIGGIVLSGTKRSRMMHPAFAPQPEAKWMHEVIRQASEERLPGARELKAAMEQDVILLKASYLASPIVLEGIPENFLTSTSEGAVLSSLWTQRLLLALQRVKAEETDKWEAISQTAFSATDPEMKAAVNELLPETGTSELDRMVSLAFTLSIFRDDHEANKAMGRIVGPKLGAYLNYLREETRPESSLVSQARILATPMQQTESEILLNRWQEVAARVENITQGSPRAQGPPDNSLVSARTRLAGELEANRQREELQSQGLTHTARYQRLGAPGTIERQQWIEHHFATKNERRWFTFLPFALVFAIVRHPLADPFVVSKGAMRIFFSMWSTFARYLFKGYGLKRAMARAWAANRAAHRWHNRFYEGTPNVLVEDSLESLSLLTSGGNNPTKKRLIRAQETLALEQEKQSILAKELQIARELDVAISQEEESLQSYENAVKAKIDKLEHRIKKFSSVPEEKQKLGAVGTARDWLKLLSQLKTMLSTEEEGLTVVQNVMAGLTERRQAALQEIAVRERQLEAQDLTIRGLNTRIALITQKTKTPAEKQATSQTGQEAVDNLVADPTLVDQVIKELEPYLKADAKRVDHLLTLDQQRSIENILRSYEDFHRITENELQVLSNVLASLVAITASLNIASVPETVIVPRADVPSSIGTSAVDLKVAKSEVDQINDLIELYPSLVKMREEVRAWQRKWGLSLQDVQFVLGFVEDRTIFWSKREKKGQLTEWDLQCCSVTDAMQLFSWAGKDQQMFNELSARIDGIDWSRWGSSEEFFARRLAIAVTLWNRGYDLDMIEMLLKANAASRSWTGWLADPDNEDEAERPEEERERNIAQHRWAGALADSLDSLIGDSRVFRPKFVPRHPDSSRKVVITDPIVQSQVLMNQMVMIFSDPNRYLGVNRFSSDFTWLKRFMNHYAIYGQLTDRQIQVATKIVRNYDEAVPNFNPKWQADVIARVQKVEPQWLEEVERYTVNNIIQATRGGVRSLTVAQLHYLETMMRRAEERQRFARVLEEAKNHTPEAMENLLELTRELLSEPLGFRIEERHAIIQQVVGMPSEVRAHWNQEVLGLLQEWKSGRFPVPIEMTERFVSVLLGFAAETHPKATFALFHDFLLGAKEQSFSSYSGFRWSSWILGSLRFDHPEAKGILEQILKNPDLPNRLPWWKVRGVPGLINTLLKTGVQKPPVEQLIPQIDQLQVGRRALEQTIEMAEGLHERGDNRASLSQWMAARAQLTDLSQKMGQLMIFMARGVDPIVLEALESRLVLLADKIDDGTKDVLRPLVKEVVAQEGLLPKGEELTRIPAEQFSQIWGKILSLHPLMSLYADQVRWLIETFIEIEPTLHAGDVLEASAPASFSQEAPVMTSDLSPAETMKRLGQDFINAVAKRDYLENLAYLASLVKEMNEIRKAHPEDVDVQLIWHEVETISLKLPITPRVVVPEISDETIAVLEEAQILSQSLAGTQAKLDRRQAALKDLKNQKNKQKSWRTEAELLELDRQIERAFERLQMQEKAFAGVLLKVGQMALDHPSVADRYFGRGIIKQAVDFVTVVAKPRNESDKQELTDENPSNGDPLQLFSLIDPFLTLAGALSSISFIGGHVWSVITHGMIIPLLSNEPAISIFVSVVGLGLQLPGLFRLTRLWTSHILSSDGLLHFVRVAGSAA